ncbi:MAG: DUF5665 domain-containing protein [Clostridiales bacterium]|nr:DUF5665 domain-containing protein [Clostridiales bacterium]
MNFLKKRKARKSEVREAKERAAREQAALEQAEKEKDPEGFWLKKTEWLSRTLERAKLGDYVTLMQTPRRLIFLNLLAGAARGFGFAIGFTILGAFVIYMLNILKILDIPLIGDFISDLIEYINANKSPGI